MPETVAAAAAHFLALCQQNNIDPSQVLPGQPMIPGQPTPGAAAGPPRPANLSSKLLVMVAQGGKTRRSNLDIRDLLLFETAPGKYDVRDNVLAVVINANLVKHSSQFTDRCRAALDGTGAHVFSWTHKSSMSHIYPEKPAMHKSRRLQVAEVKDAIYSAKLRVLSVLANSTLNDWVGELLRDLAGGDRLFDVKLYIDEVDENFRTCYEHLLNFVKDNPGLNLHYHLITATPMPLFMAACFAEMFPNGVELAAVDDDNLAQYNGLIDEATWRLVHPHPEDRLTDELRTLFGLDFPLTADGKFAVGGGHYIFCPALVLKKTHKEVAEWVMENTDGVCVLVLNGDPEYDFYSPAAGDGAGPRMDKKPGDEDAATTIRRYHEEAMAAGCSLLLTGKLCLNRAVTAQGEGMEMTHAYFTTGQGRLSSFTKDKSRAAMEANQYQTAARTACRGPWVPQQKVLIGTTCPDLMKAVYVGECGDRELMQLGAVTVTLQDLQEIEQRHENEFHKTGLARMLRQ